MTTIAWILLACAGVYAVANWFAVTTGDRLLEYIAKPSVMAFLFGVVLTVDATDEAAQAWFAVAVVLSLAGDVFLMVPGDRFVPGLASFLLAHVAYVIGFLQFDLSLPFLAVGLVAAAILIGVVGARIVQAAREAGQEELVAPVRAYIVIIGHAGGYESVYAHLQPRKKVRAGQKVKRGQVVGTIGLTGLTTGPHVHWELRKGGTNVNPLKAGS